MARVRRPRRPWAHGPSTAISLVSLPVEILELICKQVVFHPLYAHAYQGPNSTAVSTLHRDRVWKDKGSPDWNDAASRRNSRALLRLARTCRTMAAVCLPLLYRARFTVGLSSLEWLLGALARKPQSQACVRHLSLWRASCADRFTCRVHRLLHADHLALASLRSLAVEAGAGHQDTKYTRRLFSSVLAFAHATPSLACLALVSFYVTVLDMDHVGCFSLSHVTELDVEDCQAERRDVVGRLIRMFPALKSLVVRYLRVVDPIDYRLLCRPSAITFRLQYEMDDYRDGKFQRGNFLEGYAAPLESLVLVDCHGRAVMPRPNQIAHLRVNAWRCDNDGATSYRHDWLQSTGQTLETLGIARRWARRDPALELEPYPELGATRRCLDELASTLVSLKLGGMLPRLRLVDLTDLDAELAWQISTGFGEFVQECRQHERRLADVGIQLKMCAWIYGDLGAWKARRDELDGYAMPESESDTDGWEEEDSSESEESDDDVAENDYEQHFPDDDEDEDDDEDDDDDEDEDDDDDEDEDDDEDGGGEYDY